MVTPPPASESSNSSPPAAVPNPSVATALEALLALPPDRLRQALQLALAHVREDVPASSLMVPYTSLLDGGLVGSQDSSELAINHCWCWARCQLHACGSRLCGRQCGRHMSKAAGLACFPPSSLPVCLVCPLTGFAGSLFGWNRQPLPSSLAHLVVTPTPTSTAGSQDTASLLASLLNPGSVLAAGVCSPHASVCDTGASISQTAPVTAQPGFRGVARISAGPLLRPATGTPTSLPPHNCGGEKS